MSASTSMSITIPGPVRASAASAEARSATSSPCSSYSETDSNAWAPTGVYVPVHRRPVSGSSAASTAPTSASSSPRSSKLALPQSDAKPQPRVYSREDLLALAPFSLVNASLRPVITPSLLAAHPKILRAHGDGIARALDMARTPTYLHSAYAHGRGDTTVKAVGEVQTTQNPPVPHAEAQPREQLQAVRRRDRLRLAPRNATTLVNGKGTLARRVVPSANLSKQAPRRKLDMARSWRAPRAIVA